MKRIVFIPLDNRPVCYDLPIDIVNCIEDYQILLPPFDIVGGLFDVTDFEKLIHWFQNLIDVDYVIVALDTVAYGSLVASRRCALSFDDVLYKLNVFKNVLLSKNAKVLAFSSIMRISNNNINEEEKEYWDRFGKKIFDYSFNSHKAEVVCDAEANAKCSCISNIIPKDILEDYISTRGRNFKVNQIYIDWLKEGVIDTLVFSKDDCAEYGWNVKEANELVKLLKENNLNGVVKTGADEIPLTLLSRVFTENKKIKVYPYFLVDEDKNLISNYEDVSIEKSVLGQIELAGCDVVQNLENADLCLCINNFLGVQGEHVMNIDTEKFSGVLEDCDKPCAYADVRFANGSDNCFVESLLQLNFDDNFYGYAGWNTSANTLGSVLAIALAKFCANKFNDLNFKKVNLIRFLDDYVYQAIIRNEIRDDFNNLSPDILKIYMQKYEDFLINKMSLGNIKISYSYPWNRFFEVRVHIV